MRPSLSYYVLHLALRLKGVKKSFGQDPLNIERVRKEDLPFPKGSPALKLLKGTFKILGTKVTVIGKSRVSDKLILFVHGGAFVCGPARHHWDTLHRIASKTDHTVWLCDYPKAPEHQIGELSQNIDMIYQTAVKRYDPKDIILIGDSVGATLITSLTQRLLLKNQRPPHQLILVSPVMDASLSNPDIASIDPKDPMLSKHGILSAKKMVAGHHDLKAPIISPLYGSFEGFPKTILYAAEHDITYPDQILAYKKAKYAQVDIRLIKGNQMPHIWPLLPFMKEAKMALTDLINEINP